MSTGALHCVDLTVQQYQQYSTADWHKALSRFPGTPVCLLAVAAAFCNRCAVAGSVVAGLSYHSSCHLSMFVCRCVQQIFAHYHCPGAFRFSYKGLGEPLCFWAFGPLATTAFYLACSVPALTPAAAGSAATTSTAAAAASSSLLAGVSPLVVLLSVVVGITTTVILFCSHWHQIQGDIAAGKMSPLVRLGTTNACKVSAGNLLALQARWQALHKCVVCTDELYAVAGL